METGEEVMQDALSDDKECGAVNSTEAEQQPEYTGIDGAIAKLEEELKKAKDKTFADPILKHLIERCRESESLALDICQSHKNWEKCLKYIYEQARKQAKGDSCAVRDDVVYEWAEDYYHRDDKAEEEKKAKEAAKKNELSEEAKKLDAVAKRAEERAKKKPQTKEKPKPEAEGNNGEIEGQMDIFSFAGM